MMWTILALCAVTVWLGYRYIKSVEYHSHDVKIMYGLYEAIEKHTDGVIELYNEAEEESKEEYGYQVYLTAMYDVKDAFEARRMNPPKGD